jgi:hypothetical protein
MGYIGTQIEQSSITTTSIGDGIIDGDSFSNGLVVPPNTFENVIATPMLFRNKLINGNFDIWQRGTSQGGSGYGSADRWSFESVGTLVSAYKVDFSAGQIEVPHNPISYFSMNVTSSAGAGNYLFFRQKIENVRTLAGKTAVLTFWARDSGNLKIAANIRQEFGSGGSVAVDTPLGVINTSSSWTKYTVPINIPPIATKTIGADHCLTIEIWLAAGTTYATRSSSLGQRSGTFDFAQFQLEEGTLATPFEDLPIPYTTLMCERYYQRVDLGIGTGNFITSSNDADTRGRIMFNGVLRKIPTVTFNTATWAIYGVAASINAAPNTVNQNITVAATDVREHSTSIAITSPTSFSGLGELFTWTATTNLIMFVDAEL